MATFITTVKFTTQGIKSVGATTKRAAAVKTLAKKMGVKVTDIYWTLGDFDGLLILPYSSGCQRAKPRSNPLHGRRPSAGLPAE